MGFTYKTLYIRICIYIYICTCNVLRMYRVYTYSKLYSLVLVHSTLIYIPHRVCRCSPCAHGVISSTVFSFACLVLCSAVLLVEAIILSLLHCPQIQLLVKPPLPFGVAWSLLHIIKEFLYSLLLLTPVSL